MQRRVKYEIERRYVEGCVSMCRPGHFLKQFRALESVLSVSEKMSRAPELIGDDDDFR